MTKDKFSHINTAIKSFQLIFQKKEFLIPSLCMFLLSTIFIPFTKSMGALSGKENILPQEVMVIIGQAFLFGILTWIISLAFYGWVMGMIRPLLKKGAKIELKKSMSTLVHYAVKLFLVSLIIMILLIAVIIVISIIAIILSLIGLLLITISPYLGTAGIVFLWGCIILFIMFLFSGFMHLIPIISLKDLDVLETVSSTISYMFKNAKHTFIMMFIVIVISLIAYIPSFIFQLSIGSLTDPTILYQNNSYIILNYILSITYFIMLPWLIAFYSLAYAKRNNIKL